MNKKSQTEILGVAFIVIILVIAGTLMITSRLRNPRQSQLGGYVDPELAQSFLNVLMKTDTEINMKVYETIQECYNNRRDICRSGSTSNCCDYAKLVMTNALRETLGNWSRSYKLTVRREGESEKIADILFCFGT